MLHNCMYLIVIVPFGICPHNVFAVFGLAGARNNSMFIERQTIEIAGPRRSKSA